MSRDQYNALPSEEQKRDRRRAERTSTSSCSRSCGRCVRTRRPAARPCGNSTGRSRTYAAEHLVDDVRREVGAPCRKSADYLDAVLKDVIENAEDFKKSDEEHAPSFMGIAALGQAAQRSGLPQVPGERPGRQHVARRRPGRQGANPTCPEPRRPGRAPGSVRGSVDRLQHDQTRGAPRAPTEVSSSLEARDLLTKPYAWDALKRTSKTAESPHRGRGHIRWGTPPTSTLDPEPIPLDVKVVLIGEPDDLLPALPGRSRLPGALQGQGRLRHRRRSHTRERTPVCEVRRQRLQDRATAPLHRRRLWPG